MKKYIYILFLMALMISCSSNQTKSDDPVEVKGAVTTNSISKYKLYPTQNMWTSLKLDTATGQIWQVQYSVKGEEYRFETPLSLNVLNTSKVNGRYELYSTDNIYNFVMLDVVDGKTYQVQWSGEEDNRFVIPID